MTEAQKLPAMSERGRSLPDLERLIASYMAEVYAGACREAIAADTRPDAEKLDGAIVIPKEQAARWRFVSCLTFDTLPTEEKERHRHHARVVLAVMRHLFPPGMIP